MFYSVLSEINSKKQNIMILLFICIIFTKIPLPNQQISFECLIF